MAEMEYTIDPAKNIIKCEIGGFVSAETMIDYIITIRKDPDFHNDLNTITDIRNASLAEGFMEANKVADFIKMTSSDRGAFKLALITKPSNKDSAIIFAMLSGTNQVKLCLSKSDAEAWVDS
jgi:hypothetical protein